MKKLFILILCGIMLFSFLSCENENNKENQEKRHKTEDNTDTEATLEVPELVGKVLTAELQMDLEQLGFEVKYTFSEEASDELERTIIEQTPAAGTMVSVGEMIRLVLHQNTEHPIILADYTGKSFEDVTSMLDAEGIVYELIHEHNDSVSANKIFKTVPVGGTTIYKKDTVEEPVQLYISLGKQESTVEVPSFINLTVEQATLQAEEYGLAIGDITEKSSSSAKGLIIYQDIENGIIVSEGTKINLTISAGS